MTLDNIDALVFDFDGVLTNNFVYLSQGGEESVVCSRSDGLAFDVLRKINKPTFILSTEKNSIVTMRAKKLQIPSIQGVPDKVIALKKLAKEKNYDLKNILYVGNDLNDYLAMQLCGYSACPADSHKRIKEIATFVLKTKGGKGVIREILEEIFKLDLVQILYKNKEKNEK